MLLPQALGPARYEAGQALILVRDKGIWAWAGEAVLTLAETAVSTGVSKVASAEEAVARAETEAAIEEFASGLVGRDAPLAAQALRRCRELLADLAAERRC